VLGTHHALWHRLNCWTSPAGSLDLFE
jgi:hypothetical protein